MQLLRSLGRSSRLVHTVETCRLRLDYFCPPEMCFLTTHWAPRGFHWKNVSRNQSMGLVQPELPPACFTFALKSLSLHRSCFSPAAPEAHAGRELHPNPRVPVVSGCHCGCQECCPSQGKACAGAPCTLWPVSKADLENIRMGSIRRYRLKAAWQQQPRLRSRSESSTANVDESATKILRQIESMHAREKASIEVWPLS